MKTKLYFCFLLSAFCWAAPAATYSLTNIQLPKVTGYLGFTNADSAPTGMVKVGTSLLNLSNVVANLPTNGSGTINATNPVFYESITLLTGTNSIWMIDWCLSNSYTTTFGTNLPPPCGHFVIDPNSGVLTNDDGTILIPPGPPGDPGTILIPPGAPGTILIPPGSAGVSNVLQLTNAGTAEVNGYYMRVPWPAVSSVSDHWPTERWLQLPLDQYPKCQIFVWTNGYAEVGSISNSSSVGHLDTWVKTASATTASAGVLSSEGYPLNANLFGSSGTHIGSPATNWVGGVVSYSSQSLNLGTGFNISLLRSGQTLFNYLRPYTWIVSPPAHSYAWSRTVTITFGNGTVWQDTGTAVGYDGGFSGTPVITHSLPTITPTGIGPFYTRSDFRCGTSAWVTNGGIGVSSAPIQRFLFAEPTICASPVPSVITNMPASDTVTNVTGATQYYIVYNRNTPECKYLVPSPRWLDSVRAANNVGQVGPSRIESAGGGTLRLYLFGVLVETAVQGDTNYWLPCGGGFR